MCKLAHFPSVLRRFRIHRSGDAGDVSLLYFAGTQTGHGIGPKYHENFGDSGIARLGEVRRRREQLLGSSVGGRDNLSGPGRLEKS